MVIGTVEIRPADGFESRFERRTMRPNKLKMARDTFAMLGIDPAGLSDDVSSSMKQFKREQTT
jgi:hypothetical protein